MKQTTQPEPSLRAAVADFLADLSHANRSPHTLRGYASDLGKLAAFYEGPVSGITPAALRAFFGTCTPLSPATRARAEASIASFLTWAYRHDLVEANPMDKLDRVKLAPPAPRGLPRAQVEQILAGIPREQERDRLLFRLVFELGLRISEALTLEVEDFDLTMDDEHVRVLGKGGRKRTVLLDDPRLVRQLRTYLKRRGYHRGLLFRAEKNGTGGPLAYQSVQERWAGYAAKAGVTCTLHQLRHAHATEMVNDGVSLATIRKRLGHANLQTTARYAELADTAADAEVRAWRRRRAQRT